MATVKLPPLAPLPPANIRLSLAPQEWEACLETWLTLANLYLRTPGDAVRSRQESTVDFLRSYYHESAHATPQDTSLISSRGLELRKACFRLTNRLYNDTKVAQKLLEFDFIGDLCHVHARNAALSKVLHILWTHQEKALRSLIDRAKSNMIDQMESFDDQVAQRELQSLSRIFLAAPDIAASFSTGSDFLDALVLKYRSTGSLETRKVVAAAAYLGLESLVKIETPNLSLLIDHLYGLKAQADGQSGGQSLLADLVTNTNLLSNLRIQTGTSGGDRLSKLLESLQKYRSSAIARPKNYGRRRPGNGKANAVENGHEMHVHRMSLVTQIQDLFPDLGSGFILKLLDEYDDNVEQVTAHLLDDSLPSHLRNLDRIEQAPIRNSRPAHELENLAPRSTPPPPAYILPERRNIFDNDAFDRLEISSSALHHGKKESQLNPNDQPNKAAILSALSAFDADDDERDDTYDVDDVGGTVDTAHPDGEPGPSARITNEENDMALFTVYKTSPSLFARSPDVRRGQPRQALKAETGMTDEAIEGWAIMLQRDPKRLKRLEAQQAGAFDGQQSDLARTAYRESATGTETEDSDVPADRGGYRGRGRGRGRGGRGRGSVAGPSGDPSTASAQRRKEANKGSRANHNRRDQRAKKMARGGFPG